MPNLGTDPEKLYRATFICQYSLCCYNMALVSFRMFRKKLGNLQEFFGQMVYRPLAKKIARTPMIMVIPLMGNWGHQPSVQSLNSYQFPSEIGLLQAGIGRSVGHLLQLTRNKKYQFDNDSCSTYFRHVMAIFACFKLCSFEGDILKNVDFTGL